MKNLLQQKPDDKLDSRLLASVNFVKDNDVTDKVILDIGCGFGWCEINFLSRGVKHITGIEISDADLIAARSGINDPRANFVTAGALELPFPDSSFDTVVSWEVIEHIPRGSEPTMFREVSRVLKPGGTFYLSTPYRSFLSNVLDPAWWLIGHRHYSKESLSTYATDSSLIVQKIIIRGRIFTLLSTLDMYISKWVFRRKPLFYKFLTSRKDKEYRQNKGYANIFVKFKKSKL